MTDPYEVIYGAAKEYRILARTDPETGIGGYFYFTEKFYESDDPRFDALLLLGARLNHRYVEVLNQDVANSWLWRGFSKRGRSLTRLFIKEISVVVGNPSFNDINTGNDYTKIDSIVGTTDHGVNNLPDHASEGVLASIAEITGYAKSVDAVNNRNWINIKGGNTRWVYPDLELTLPLAFYHRTYGYGQIAKQAYVMWKILAGVRFMASEKSAKHVKKLKLGGIV